MFPFLVDGLYSNLFGHWVQTDEQHKGGYHKSSNSKTLCSFNLRITIYHWYKVSPFLESLRRSRSDVPFSPFIFSLIFHSSEHSSYINLEH